MKRIIPLTWLITAALLSASFVVAGENGNDNHPASAVQLPAGARTSEHIYGNLPGLANVGRVAPGVYRGAQPAAEAEMHSFGFNGIWVNFKRFIKEYAEQLAKK